jgi:putative addiction module component (TIGR02574 family)
MSAIANLYSQALRLPAAQREELVALLFDSLPDNGDALVEVGDELEQEIARRLADREDGTATTVDLETFRTAIRAAARRPGAT